MDRQTLNRLLADIAAGKIDCVVVYKVDRLSRSLMDFSRIMETFDNHGASFVSVTQQFNTTHSMGRLTLNILLSFAQFEREIIVELIRDKISAQRRRGKWTGGVSILGYDVDRSAASPKLVSRSPNTSEKSAPPLPSAESPAGPKRADPPRTVYRSSNAIMTESGLKRSQ
jgi:site-specific DNA recombinase